MATFTIDGKEIEIVPGKNVLKTALDNGIHIPHYCYHPGLSAPGNCRMCMVEIEVGGRRSLLTSCTTMPAEGMVVETKTEAVARHQQAVMEFLLVNHPLDCPVCDQAGECDLQNYSYTYGPGKSRFAEEKVVQPKKDIGKHILLYSDRCIRCTRCIRFCDEISGTHELGYFNRGVHNEIDIFPGERLDNRMSGNTVDICPVGALLDREFLFKQRVWFLKGTDTVCAGCSAGCSIRADINNERIYRLVPRQNPAVNDYWMCDDGRYGWGHVHSDSRLLFPLLGQGQAEALALWEAALARVVEGFAAVREAHGEGAVAGIASGHLTNEEQYLFGKLFKGVLKGGPVALRPKLSAEGDVVFKSGFTVRADKTPNTRGAREILGALGLPVLDASEIWKGIQEGRIQALYFLGGDPAERLSETEKAALGGVDFLVVQDILASELTRMAHVTLPGAAFIEKDGTFTNHAGHVQQIRRGLAPPGDARADWEILRDVANAMDGGFAYADVREVWAELVGTVKAFAGMDLDRIGDRGAPLAAAEE